MTQPEIFLCSKCYCIYYSIHISFVHSLLIYLSCYFAHVQMESLYIIQKTAKTTKKSSNIHQGCSVDFVRYYIVWKRIAKDNLSHNALLRIILKLFYFTILALSEAVFFSSAQLHHLLDYCICSKFTCQECYNACHDGMDSGNILIRLIL